MIPLSISLVALAVLASLGCWLLVRGLWPAGARGYLAYGLAASGLFLLLGAVALLAWKLPVLSGSSRGTLPAVEFPEGNLRVDFPWTLEIETDPRTGRVDVRPPNSEDSRPDDASNADDGPLDATEAIGWAARDDWPATHCVARYRAWDAATASMRWFLRNECGRPVAVLFAWCDMAASECWSPESDRAGLRWNYVEEGVVLSDYRSGVPAVARTPTDQVFVDHLACYVTSPTATAFVSRSQGFDTDAHWQGEAGEMAEISDECLRVMRSCSRYGNTLGRSPATLFR